MGISKKIILLVGLVLFLIPTVLADNSASDSEAILIGVEYVTSGLGETLAEIGAIAVKYLPADYEWGKMQRSPNAAIDFNVTDRYVKEYQGAGFKELVFCLKSHSQWASKNFGRLKSGDPTPKPQYMDAYAKWVAAIVERYDGDGNNDMPGLRWPVRRFEIGGEFSTYEPEPVEDYLKMLERAYGAAHAASDNVIIAHVPFFDAGIYDGSINYPKEHIVHFLDDVHKILDRPDIFDIINLHALFAPYEIEKTVSWIKNEMHKRGYHKPIIISDTAPNGISLFGRADVYQGARQKLGYLMPPATETDRSRIARYFTKLLNGDDAALRWAQTYGAQDNIQKVVIAAEQEVSLIDTSFTEDLSLLATKIFKGGGGIGAWAGMVQRRGGRVVERRAGFYALKQLIRHMKGYASIRRISVSDDRVRLYELNKAVGRLWIAWMDPKKLILPEDDIPEVVVSFETGSSVVVAEEMVTRFGQTEPDRLEIQAVDGRVTLKLTPTPIYVWNK